MSGINLTPSEFRARVRVAREDAAGQRPACDLTSLLECDDEGRVWLAHTCWVHGGVSWRELIAAVVDHARGSELVSAAGIFDGTPCGASVHDAEGGGE